MIKVDLCPLTWGYYEFITNKECLALLDWANSNFKNLQKNQVGGERYFSTVANLKNIPSEFYDVKTRIVETEKIHDAVLDPYYGDFLSFNLNTGSIHPHKDDNLPGRVHTRYNLLLATPDQGGDPVYDGQYIIPYKDRMLWRCEAGKYQHESLPVVGTKPRINISFGFQI